MSAELMINDILDDHQVPEYVHKALVNAFNGLLESVEVYRDLLDKCAEAIGKEAYVDEEDLLTKLSAMKTAQARLEFSGTQNDAAIRQLNQAYRVIDKLTAYIDKLEAGR